MNSNIKDRFAMLFNMNFWHDMHKSLLNRYKSEWADSVRKVSLFLYKELIPGFV